MLFEELCFAGCYLQFILALAYENLRIMQETGIAQHSFTNQELRWISSSFQERMCK